MNRGWSWTVFAIAAVAGLVAAPRPCPAQTSERLDLERRDGNHARIALHAIRRLVPAGSGLVVLSDGAEPSVPFADIRRLRFEPTTTAVDPGGPGRIEAIRLLQNRPNPATRATTIGFALARRGHVTLEIFSVSGRRIRTLADGVLDAGAHAVVWDGADAGGRRVDAGVYFYRLKGLGRVLSRRAVILP